jgi:hypothetical protein
VAASDPTAVPAGVSEERVDALFGLPIDDFTPSRDALAKELRQQGERAAAAWVKALRKPSAAAWVVNQLARTQPGGARALVEAGTRLRSTHEGLLAGSAGADDLRSAAAAEREAASTLLSRASGLLDGDGRAPSGATLARAAETLQAVALDHDARAAFAAGRLTRELRATGAFGGAGGAAASGARRQPKRAAKPRGSAASKRGAKKPAQRDTGPTQAERRKEAQQTLKRAKESSRTRRRALREAERELARAEREATRAKRELDSATAALERAQAADAEATAAVDAARERA